MTLTSTSTSLTSSQRELARWAEGHERSAREARAEGREADALVHEDQAQYLWGHVRHGEPA